jgi:hypothetical protein
MIFLNNYNWLLQTVSNIPVSDGVRGGIKRRNPEEALFPSHNSASTATPPSRLGYAQTLCSITRLMLILFFVFRLNVLTFKFVFVGKILKI